MLSSRVSFLDDVFPNFYRFQKLLGEGYHYLRNDIAETYGRPIGPDQEAYRVGCLSKQTSADYRSYDETIRTTLDSIPWPMAKTKWSDIHVISLLFKEKRRFGRMGKTRQLKGMPDRRCQMPRDRC